MDELGGGRDDLFYDVMMLALSYHRKAYNEYMNETIHQTNVPNTVEPVVWVVHYVPSVWAELLRRQILVRATTKFLFA